MSAHTANTDKTKAHSIFGALSIGAAALILSVASPANAEVNFNHVSFDSFSFDEDEDFLEQLIELDADDIEDVREEMAEASVEIRDAITEIDDAREEVKAAPGGSAILEAALAIASSFAEKAMDEGFAEATTELDRVEDELHGMENELSAEEYAETQLAIDTIRSEMAEIEVALGELLETMKA